MTTEWFQQQSPKYKAFIRRILVTSCPECFTEISGWKKETEDDSAFLTISVISVHDALWHKSLKGRLKTAWIALKGDPAADISFDTQNEVDAFCAHLQEVSRETFAKE